jgi:2-iminobutanoate/2-iminopropanoate deaminase
MKRRIDTDLAPRPVGPYSQAIEADGWVWCAGQIGVDPNSGRLVDGGVAAEAERALRNLESVLVAAGATLSDVVKTTVLLADIADFTTVNEIYARVFPDPAPARSTFAVAALPRGALVEIEAVARAPRP